MSLRHTNSKCKRRGVLPSSLTLTLRVSVRIGREQYRRAADETYRSGSRETSERVARFRTLTSSATGDSHRPLAYKMTARRSASMTSTAGALLQKPHGRVIVTVLLPASLPVLSLTKTLNEATSPGLSRPVVVLRLSVSAGTVATTVAAS